ncbi:unnamed protein product [Dibothriocephalus latus]|uniref:Uncharacterized protein n=1 Tax=Dibothriocephalus latus TaxID=60516 RepID=A0A3P7RJW2_DIBLA|nr:unnamed protein product [Dibothriocephalus latus]
MLSEFPVTDIITLQISTIRRYVLTSTAPGLSSLSSNDLGPTLKFAEFGLSCVSHTDPFIRAHAGELCVRLAYQQKLPLQWTAKLNFVTNDSTEDCSDMVSTFFPDRISTDIRAPSQPAVFSMAASPVGGHGFSGKAN